MKKHSALLLCLLLSTCEPAHAFGRKSHPAPSPVPSASPSTVPVSDPDPIPDPDTYPVSNPSPQPPKAPRVSVGTITGATPAEVIMIKQGVDLANKVLAAPCFKQWVLAARYTENNGLTQAQIWDVILRHDKTVDVEMYTGTWKANHVWKTVGYENDPFDGVVHMNRYFVNTPFMVADNLWHEHKGHSPGFHHYLAHATSQPYGMNYAGEGCSNQQQQMGGAKAYKPPGIRLEIRHVKKSKKF